MPSFSQGFAGQRHEAAPDAKADGGAECADHRIGRRQPARRDQPLIEAEHDHLVERAGKGAENLGRDLGHHLHKLAIADDRGRRLDAQAWP
jgi:hypothetical protein